MEVETPNTKTALILAAGPLFAELGVGGTSIRMIASEAKANVASVNYHFGNKENLYLAVFQYVINKLHTTYFHEAWYALPPERKNPEQIRIFIRETILETYHNFLRRGYPRWFYTLLMRELSAPGQALESILKHIILPTNEAARELFALVKPNAARYEAQVWMDIWFGQIFFFATTFETHLLLDNWSEGEEQEYIDQAAESTVRLSLGLLGLS